MNRHLLKVTVLTFVLLLQSVAATAMPMAMSHSSIDVAEHSQSQPCHSSADSDASSNTKSEQSCCDNDNQCLEHCTAVAVVLSNRIQRNEAPHPSSVRFLLDAIALHAPYQLEILRPPIPRLQ